jgi:cytoskeleton protein RodZ
MSGELLMSEGALNLTGDLSGSIASTETSLTAGARLRLAREATGLHIAALAVSLKVPVNKLEALEGDRIDLLPDAVFARALASSVCRTLKIDPAPILATLPPTSLARLVPDSLEGGDSFREPKHGSRRTLRDVITKPFVVIGALLVVGAVGIALFPVIEKPLPVVADVPVDVNGSSAVTQPTSSSLPSNKPVVTAAPVINEAVVALTQPEGKSDSVAALPVVVTAPASSPANPAAVAGILVLKSKGASWVEVTDASGIVQLRKTMTIGETIGVSGGLPLSVIVGKVDTTEVQIRGKTFDMTPLTKDNVARFEVR